MKILIASDMEGVSGIDRPQMCEPRSTPEYEAGRKKLMADVNAAVDGAFAGGAGEVFVVDGHGGGGNFIDKKLDQRAIMLSRLLEIDDTFAAGMFVGRHAMAGTINAFMDHSFQHGAIYKMMINGRECGETATGAAVLGYFGVPLVMVSGCEVACKQARDFIGEIECAVVKRAMGRNRAVLVDEAVAHERIHNAARQSLTSTAEIRPFGFIYPAEVIKVFCRTELADRYCNMPGIERVDARTVRYVAADALELNR